MKLQERKKETKRAWAEPVGNESGMRTAMIQITEKDNILLLPSFHTKMPGMSTEKNPIPVCSHVTPFKTAKGGDNQVVIWSRFPEAVWFIFQKCYPEAIGLVQHSSYRERRHTHTHFPHTTRAKWIFHIIFVAKYMTLYFC